ncbi:AmpG family muropeptide MFS transporter [Henriciella aquimarina]|uniref:AmpG family muropeptide MFS transporter n=1 Tax=Henriciella aquimarina TaxID=545261 RepID=UPI0009FC2CD4|nr:hypothetical protein [Henriciella aquimarina]
MTSATEPDSRQRSFGETLKEFAKPKMAMMLVLGFTAGLPFLLYFSTLSVWLKENEIDEALIGFFSWFGLAYSFKFVWAPLVDRFNPPGLAKIFGRRRAWIFVAQIGVALAMVGLGFTNPAASLGATALFSFLIAFSSATQDIGIDAWRIEAAANDDEQATLAAAYQYGYKVGMVLSGGVALVIAGVANFPVAYWAMAATMGLGALVFAIWDRRFGIQAAAAAGIILLAVGLAAAFGAFAGIFEAGALWAVLLRALSWLFYGVTAIGAVGFVIAVTLALRDRPEGSEFSFRGLILGLGFAVAVFLGVAVFAALLGFALPKLFGLLGIEMSKGDVAKTAIYIAAAPILACAISIPFIRRLKADAPVMRNPTFAPFIDFFWRHGWIALLILLFVSAYRLSDIVMGIMAKPAYTHMGYDAEAIGIVSGTYGPWIIFVGVALAGLSALKFGLRNTLVIGAVVSVLGNLTFAWLVNQSSESLLPLFLAVTADNIAGGYAGTVFVAFMSTMVAKSFAGTQYAIFSSIYSLGPKLVAGTSGVMVEFFSGGVDTEATVAGYSQFFLFAGALGVPAIILSWFAHRMKPDRESVFDNAPPPVVAEGKA